MCQEFRTFLVERLDYANLRSRLCLAMVLIAVWPLLQPWPLRGRSHATAGQIQLIQELWYPSSRRKNTEGRYPSNRCGSFLNLITILKDWELIGLISYFRYRETLWFRGLVNR